MRPGTSCPVTTAGSRSAPGQERWACLAVRPGHTRSRCWSPVSGQSLRGWVVVKGSYNLFNNYYNSAVLETLAGKTGWAIQ